MANLETPIVLETLPGTISGTLLELFFERFGQAPGDFRIDTNGDFRIDTNGDRRVWTA